MKHLLYSFIFLFLAACQSEEPTAADSPTIKFDYYLRLDQGVDVARSDARFIYVDDTAQVALQEVKFEDIAMKGIPVGNGMMQYSYNDKMELKDSYNLNFTTKEGTKHTYDFPIIKINDFFIKEGKISKSKGFTIVWDGEDTKRNETMVILITDVKEAQLR